MGEAVAFAIPFALGVALNPIPVLAIVLILAAPRGLLRGTALLLGALSSLAIIVVVLFALESGADPIEDGETATWVSVVQLVLGLALLALAARKWRSRPGVREATSRRCRGGCRRSRRSRPRGPWRPAPP